MAAKVTAEGPIEMTTSEANTLRVMVKDLIEQLTIAQGVNLALAEALTRQGFQLTHHEHSDGSVSYDLQNAPQPREIAEIMN